MRSRWALPVRSEVHAFTSRHRSTAACSVYRDRCKFQPLCFDSMNYSIIASFECSKRTVNHTIIRFVPFGVNTAPCARSSRCLGAVVPVTWAAVTPSATSTCGDHRANFTTTLRLQVEKIWNPSGRGPRWTQIKLHDAGIQNALRVISSFCNHM